MNRFRACLLAIAAALTFTGTASAHYDPTLGRWVSRDPIGEQGGVNLHGVVGNSPISDFDVLGFSSDRIDHGNAAACKCVCVWITRIVVDARKAPNQKGMSKSFDGTTIQIDIQITIGKRKESGAPTLQYFEMASKVDDHPLTMKFAPQAKAWVWFDAADATKNARGTMFDDWHWRPCNAPATTITLIDKSRRIKQAEAYHHWINIIGKNPPCAPKVAENFLNWGGYFFYPRPGEVLHSINGGPLK